MMASPPASRPLAECLVSEDDDAVPQDVASHGSSTMTNAAFGNLYTHFRQPLAAYFRRKLVPANEVEDLAHHVFLRLIRRFSGASAEIQPRYVFTIAENILKDRGRRQSTERQDGGNVLAFGRPATVQQPADELEPERVLLSREKLACVLAGLDEAPKRTRDIFLLFRLDGMKQRDIASTYGISVSAVEKHIVKGLHHVEKALRRYDADRL